MSSPSFENIDRWLFEYTEGNLSPSQVEQLEQFLFLNPDLALEKESWDAAKVTQSQTPVFSSANIQRANPLPLFLWTGIAGLFLLTISTLAFDASIFSVSSRYVKESIDTFRIEGSADNDFVLAYKDNIQNNSLETSSNPDINTSALSSQTMIQNSENKVSAKSNISEQPISGAQEDHFIDYKNVDDNVTQAPELQTVIASLSSSEQMDDALAKSPKRVSVSKSGMSSSKAIKRKFKDAFRKIKRMADQPVALRNYKDPYFHAPYMTGYQANFGMVGTLLRNRFQATSRNQFVGRDNQQLMNTLSWDGYIYALRGGVGVDLNYSDYQNGSLQNFNAGLTYSPKFSINNNISIEPALRFKMGMIDLDTESPIIGDQIELNRRSVLGVFDQGMQPIGSQLWYRDIGAGFLLNTKWFYAGFNVDNINRHYNNFYSADINTNHQADVNMTSIIGTSYSPQGKDITYSAYLLHQKFDDLNEVWGGANIRWNWFEFGGGVSNNLDFGASAGVNLDKFSLHYNIDYLDSRLINKQLLSHQVTMRVILKPSGMVSRFLSL